jgi:hypothetical protein
VQIAFQQVQLWCWDFWAAGRHAGAWCRRRELDAGNAKKMELQTILFCTLARAKTIERDLVLILVIDEQTRSFCA